MTETELYCTLIRNLKCKLNFGGFGPLSAPNGRKSNGAKRSVPEGPICRLLGALNGPNLPKLSDFVDP